jgi:hypothetical protein
MFKIFLIELVVINFYKLRYIYLVYAISMHANAQRIKRVEAEPAQDAFPASPLLALSFVGFMFSEVFRVFCLVFNFCRGQPIR